MGQGIKEYFLVAAAPELGLEEQQVWAKKRGGCVLSVSQNQPLT